MPEQITASDSTVPEMTSGEQSSLKTILETSGKLLVCIAGLCYVAGLMVVTVHLRSYGLNSLSLSQLHYVTAGVWVILPVLVGTSFFLFVKLVFEGQEDRGITSGKRRLGEIFLAIPVIATLFYFAVKVVSSSFLGIRLTWTSWLLIPFGTVAFSGLAFVIVDLLRGEARGDGKQLTAYLVLLLIFAFLSLTYILAFATYTFREIPGSTGGGRPSQVELVVASDAIPVLEILGIKFSPGQARTESLMLLMATEREYVIVSPDGKAVSVSASLVKAVIYEK